MTTASNDDSDSENDYGNTQGNNSGAGSGSAHGTGSSGSTHNTLCMQRNGTSNTKEHHNTTTATANTTTKKATTTATAKTTTAKTTKGGGRGVADMTVGYRDICNAMTTASTRLRGSSPPVETHEVTRQL